MSRFEGWLVGRVAGGVVRVGAGLLLGAAAGQAAGWPLAGMAGGALVAVLWSSWRDARRAARLADWLHGPTDRPAPRERGFWGELAYRAERLLRKRAPRT